MWSAAAAVCRYGNGGWPRIDSIVREFAPFWFQANFSIPLHYLVNESALLFTCRSTTSLKINWTMATRPTDRRACYSAFRTNPLLSAIWNNVGISFAPMLKFAAGLNLMYPTTINFHQRDFTRISDSAVFTPILWKYNDEVFLFRFRATPK